MPEVTNSQNPERFSRKRFFDQTHGLGHEYGRYVSRYQVLSRILSNRATRTNFFFLHATVTADPPKTLIRLPQRISHTKTLIVTSSIDCRVLALPARLKECIISPTANRTHSRNYSCPVSVKSDQLSLATGRWTLGGPHSKAGRFA